MALGFVFAAIGDWFMVVMGNVTGGIIAFSFAQALWMSSNWREGRPDTRIVLTGAFPLALLFVWRIWPNVYSARLALMCGYSVLSIAALAVAMGTRRLWYRVGIMLLFISDVCIALRMAHIPYWRYAVGPTYVGALVCLIVSTVSDANERRARETSDTTGLVIGFGLCAGVLFAAAMLACPEQYDPFFSMLSRTGRISIAAVSYPICHYLFSMGMFAAAVSVWCALSGWGGAMVSAGLLAIAAVPEDVSAIGHNIGCHVATLGGVIAVVSRMRNRFGRISAFVLFVIVGLFGACIAFHALGVMPFAPAVPTLQKLVILSFAVWTVLQLFHCKRG